jgi:hypothetical protein
MVIVTTDNDERAFKADSWDVSADKTLAVFGNSKLVAQYAQGSWQAVHHAAADAHAASTDEDLAETAYTSYCAAVAWTSVGGERLPAWDKQSAALRIAWASAAAAVRVAVESAREGP